MKVSELFTALSFGELSNLSMSCEGSGNILEADKPKIILAANEALLRLYSRFILAEKDVLIEMVGHITNYHLLKRFAESNFDPKKVRYPYIKDLVRDQFEEDVIKVLAVYNSYGQELPLNNDESLDSMFTPQPQMLQIPRPRHGVSISVLYQAKHAVLGGEDCEMQDIILPDTLDGALRAFVAYKIYTNMGTQESTAKAAEHQAMYEAVCKEVESMDLVNSTISSTSKRFHKNGWA